MTEEQFRQFYNEYFYYILAAQIGVGLLFGLVPLIFGIRNGKRQLGLIGFLSAGVAGVFPVISLVVAAVFTVLVLRKPQPATASDVSQKTPE